MSKTNILNGKIVRGPSYDFQEIIEDVSVYREQLPFGFISRPLQMAMNNWIPEVPIAIFSDTGTGKNYFVENVLVPNAKAYGQGVLLVTNRVALGHQTKLRIAEMFKEEWKLSDYSEQGIDKLTDFGNITAVSYQQLSEWKNQGSENLKKLKRNFRYTVFDEIHYCLSDCGFNAMTDLVLDFITSEFQDSIRIYMTATPEQIFPILMRKEMGKGMVYDCNGWRMGLYKWHIYQFAHNFNQIIPYAFQDAEDVIALIKKTDTNEKSVVFVENRELGNSIIRQCGFGDMITADSKKPQAPSHEVYADIVDKEKFDGRLLVCTAVLENGVNLKDVKIKNVVIFANEKTRFLQMLGRVRRDPEQVIDLYMQDESISNISGWITALKNQSKALDMYYANATAFCSQFITDNNPRANIRGVFALMKDGSSHINELRKIQIENFELPFWLRIKELMEGGDKYALLREKFSWIEQKFTKESILLGDGYGRALTEFILFLDSVKEKNLPKNEQDKFKNNFSEKYRAVYGKRDEDKSSDQNYGAATIKACLNKSELPYELFSDRNGWVIKKIETFAQGDNHYEEEN